MTKKQKFKTILEIIGLVIGIITFLYFLKDRYMPIKEPIVLSSGVFNKEYENKVFYSFKFSETNKKMRLLYNSKYLIYIFTDKDENVELLCEDMFSYSIKNNILSFQNENTTYKVTSYGIVIIPPNRDMKADKKTVKGSLQYILKNKYKNVHIED